jgi:4-hydroxybenzoate polyprenyltransferase
MVPSSERPRLGAGRLAGLVRLTHPFPSLVNALATLSMATLAGGAGPVAVRLAGSMLALQVSIGALNDIVDAGIDSGRKPGKPIPRGVVGIPAAAVVAGGGLATGLLLSAASGSATLVVALAGVSCGYAYDLRLSRTHWSWLPLAVALPLVPLHAWIGTTGTPPAPLLPLLPVGVVAGAGLAVGNGLVDMERDAAAAVATPAVALGRSRAWLVHALALGVAVAGAVVLAPRPTAPAWIGLAAVGAVAVALGVALTGLEWPAARERGWELEALGVAGLGVWWLIGLASV